jgi:hypothetical protein
MGNFLTFQVIYSMEHQAARGVVIRAADSAPIAGACSVQIATAQMIFTVLDAGLFCLETGQTGKTRVSISSKAEAK